MKKLLFLLCIIPYFALAEEIPAIPSYDLIISASRIHLPANQIGSTVEVLTKEDLKNQDSLSQALPNFNSTTIRQNGAIGKNSQVSIRGANPEQSSLRLDDIEIYDASGIGRGVDLNLISLDNIERIELLYGAQSTLYGSNALAGVVNLSSIKGQGKLKASFNYETGSYNYNKATAGISGSKNNFYYAVSASKLFSSSVSAYAKNLGGKEKDAFWQDSISAKLGVDVAEYNDLNIDYVLHYTKNTNELDGFLLDKNNDFSQDELFAHRVKLSFDIVPKKIKQTLLFSQVNMNRVTFEEKIAGDPWSTADTDYRFKSQVNKFEWQNNFDLFENVSFVLGFNFEEEKGKTSTSGAYSNQFDKSMSHYGFFAENTNQIGENLTLNLSMRFDDYQKFNSKVIYKVAAAYILPTDTILRASVGTGYRAPSLYQLYDGNYGSKDLKPEEVLTYDIGLEHAFFEDKLVAKLTYFDSYYKNLIDFDLNTWKYFNNSKAHIQGVESSLSYQITPKLNTEIKLSYLDAEDGDNKRLLRRPFWTGSASLAYQPIKDLRLATSVFYIGERLDNANGKTEKSPDYTLVNLFASYQINDYAQVYGEINNLFDKKYMAIYGYGTYGINFMTGVKFTF